MPLVTRLGQHSGGRCCNVGRLAHTLGTLSSTKPSGQRGTLNSCEVDVNRGGSSAQGECGCRAHEARIASKMRVGLFHAHISRRMTERSGPQHHRRRLQVARPLRRTRCLRLPRGFRSPGCHGHAPVISHRGKAILLFAPEQQGGPRVAEIV
jgi:hypothetical protein